MADPWEVGERISNVISGLLSFWLLIQMMGDLLGIDVLEALKTIITRPWVIPIEWIEMYYPLWYAMEWALLIIMFADNIYTMRYMSEHRRPPPEKYERAVSLAVFLISFWLAILFRYLTFTVICIFAAITFSYTMFVKKG